MKGRSGKAALAALLVCLCLAAAGCPASGGIPDETLPDGSGTETEERTVYLIVDGTRAEVTLAGTDAAAALAARLEEGDVTFTADEYGGFEKVGSPGFSLPQSDTRLTTQPGDIVLYLGNQIVLFYGSNTWSYTRIGAVAGLTNTQIADLFRAGESRVSVTFTLSP